MLDGILGVLTPVRKTFERALAPTNADGIRSIVSSDAENFFVSGGLDGVVCIWRWIKGEDVDFLKEFF